MARQPPSNPLRHPLIPPTPEETAKWREEAAKWREEAVARISREFEIAVLILGDEEARLRWKEAAKKQRGRKQGSTRPEQDTNLIKLYDSLAAMPRAKVKTLPRQIGKVLSGKRSPYFGDTTTVTPEAIAIRVRRLLKQRDDERRARSYRNPLDPDWRNK